MEQPERRDDERKDDERQSADRQDEATNGAVTRVGVSARRTALMGAVFLMATSSIGPGFITQTTEFTADLGAAFAFAIVVSILVDIAIQLNVWRVIGVSGQRAQELGNRLLPGLGWVLAALVFIGGLVFNIGNVAGAGLGGDAMLGLETKIGGALSAAIAIAIFLSKRAGIAMDRVVIVLGLVMITLTVYVAITSGPPVGDALQNTFVPEQVDFLVITTLIGGTVGGYITYSGAHRMIDSGISGPERVREITRSSVTGIVVTGAMRVVLFLAILGVVAGGANLAEADNAPATAFQHAAGDVGMRVFGIVFWAAAITSVIGASYTSVSFITTSKTSDRSRNLLVVGFIALTAVLYLLIEQPPATILVAVGAFNGLLLPFGIGILLWIAWRRRDLLQGYRYPVWLFGVGLVAWLLTLFFGWNSLEGLGEMFA